MPVEALTFHAPVRRWSNPMPVIARFHHAVQALAPSGQIVTLTSGELNGPLTIRMSQAGLDVIGSSIKITSTSCPNPTGRGDPSISEIDLTKARPWRPPSIDFPLDAHTASRRSRWIRSHARRSAFLNPTPMGTALTRGRNRVISAVRTGSAPWRVASDSLVGLGPGLTPAGDDWLCGFALSVSRLGGQAPEWMTASSRLARSIAAGALHAQTTPLSRTLLFYAGRGIANEAAYTLATRLGQPTVDLSQSLDSLLALGGTSGSDMALGLADGADLALGWMSV